jgi:hypothetical protein
MSEEEKKKPFFDPNGLYRLKNIVGFTSVVIGFMIAGLFMGLFLVVAFGSFVADDGGEVLDRVLEYLSSWKIDVGLAILLGSTIISGGILLSGIRKVA